MSHAGDNGVGVKDEHLVTFADTITFPLSSRAAGEVRLLAGGGSVLSVAQYTHHNCRLHVRCCIVCGVSSGTMDSPLLVGTISLTLRVSRSA